MWGGGFLCSAEQVQIKLKHLKRLYYDVKKKNNVSGHNRVSCHFGDALEELLGPRPLSQEDNVGVDVGFETSTGKLPILHSLFHCVLQCHLV